MNTFFLLLIAGHVLQSNLALAKKLLGCERLAIVGKTGGRGNWETWLQ